MYEFDGFGKRIEALRKAKGMTQEELATRLGITSQAVSKWENNASYPDITQIPVICTILGTTLDDLFGKIKEENDYEENANDKFPQRYNGLNLVLAFKDIACYSDKKIKSTDETNITFEDGSMAELANRRIVNRGKGEIKLFTFKKKLFTNKMQDIPEAKNANFVFGKISDFDFSIRHCRLVAEKSDTDQTTVDIEGEPEFVEAIKTECNGDKLIVKFESGILDLNTMLKSFNWQDNKITVKLACDETNDLNASIHGNGEATVGVDFRNSNVSIHGSGKMDLPTFGNAIMSIHGSGNLNVKAAKNAKMSIHGSGNMKIGESGSVVLGIHGSGNVSVDKLNEGVSVSIHGSGNVGIHSGEISSCEFKMFGGGVVNAESVTTDKAKIQMHGGGRVTIGRVKQESVENIHGGGKINILNRGE